MRSGWEWDDSYLFMNTARTARGHQSADYNGLQITAFGRSMLQSDGPPDYFEVLPAGLTNNLSEFSSFKVNTVLVDGLSQARPDVNLTVPDTTIGNSFSFSDKLDFSKETIQVGMVT